MQRERAPLGDLNARPTQQVVEAPLKMIKASPAKINKQEDIFTSPKKSLADPEPLTDPSSDRYTMFPIKYQSIWEFYKKAEASFWTGK